MTCKETWKDSLIVASERTAASADDDLVEYTDLPVHLYLENYNCRSMPASLFEAIWAEALERAAKRVDQQAMTGAMGFAS